MVLVPPPLAPCFASPFISRLCHFPVVSFPVRADEPVARKLAEGPFKAMVTSIEESDLKPARSVAGIFSDQLNESDGPKAINGLFPTQTLSRNRCGLNVVGCCDGN